jgi:hypothetical protein
MIAKDNCQTGDYVMQNPRNVKSRFVTNFGKISCKLPAAASGFYANEHELIPWFGKKQHWRQFASFVSNHSGVASLR